MIAYIDTSAAAKLFGDESESNAVRHYLDDMASSDAGLASSALMETELRRAAGRRGVAQATVNAILDRIDIFDLSRSMYSEAGVLPGANLRSLDALHVVAALRINADLLVSYDESQISAATALGLRVHSPT